MTSVILSPVEDLFGVEQDCMYVINKETIQLNIS